MSKFFVAIGLFVVFFQITAQSSDGSLKSVILLYRHGDRAPIRPYPYDPYDERYWPLGFGQLTNIGKKQQYALGQWLRSRYNDFLPSTYNRKDIKVQSSNVDRCLMSAQLNLAGLYPPEGSQIWNENLPWQPIPIHTVPEKEDAILAQEKPCPKYGKLYQELMQGEPFSKMWKDKAELVDELKYNTGENLTTLEQLLDLYNTLYIEKLHLTYLPSWSKDILTDEMEKLCNVVWTSYAYTEDLARLRSGPLIDLILHHFEDVRNNVGDAPKFLMLSAHDSTIAPLLTAMKVFDYKWPDYASSLLFELREDDENEFVNIFYRNPTDVANLTLPDCDFDCGFEKFQKLLAPIRTSPLEWLQECLSA